MTDKSIPAILVSPTNALEGSGGGVQICTAEYRAVLAAAGFQLELLPFEADMRFLIRFLRKFEGMPYRRILPPGLLERIRQKAAEVKTRFVFFNLVDFTPLAQKLRQELRAEVKLVHLSHGLASTDICIRQQVKRIQSSALRYDRAAAGELGAMLQWEGDYRRNLDASLCLSPFDAELEKWLGVPSAAWFPRTARRRLLDVSPVDGRVGCVGTLSHPPNRIGLSALFEKLKAQAVPPFHFRLVGGPESEGRSFAREYPFVQYLGALPDNQLIEEVKSWCCFVHPILQPARGCSTKLAVALGWGLPVATTRFGSRGYVWDESAAPLPTTLSGLADATLQRSRARDFETHRQESLRTLDLQPRIEDVSREVRRYLLGLA